MRILHLRLMVILLFAALSLFAEHYACAQAAVSASKDKTNQADVLQQRMQLFCRFEAVYGIPWTYLAAIDQYERTISKHKKHEKTPMRLTAIDIPPAVWSGYLNPEQNDTNESSIAFFGGIGLDGSGDGLADRNNDADVLAAIIQQLAEFGYSSEDFRIGLWTYYKRERAVQTIEQFSKVYKKYLTLDLQRHTFPIPKPYNYSYKSTWGTARDWGGRRIHEGTDIFADYSTPIQSTGYGVIEIIGWNRFGGWRIGIRDMDNVYHYYAHLSAFRKGLKAGDIVEPGQIIGYVGSSGYGKPGTSGKFPPHLHYGMYIDNGNSEWAFDPFPKLKSWERMMYRKKEG
ncbi:M23 family metallopeptidase [Brevibacillus sp. B_LB10_24]|uniref:M23 family metallopeptidase n=1 Tax=Brevibacillus sp. B_LB10_24 TaxID=3380645 RepID=UPI0038BA3203